MMEHDETVGTLLKALDDMGVANNTIVVYTSDNGASHEHVAGRRHDVVPLREEHQLGGRLPRALPGPLARHIKPGTVTNEIMSHNDWIPRSGHRR